MSPRKPAVLSADDAPNLRDHLIATAARLIDQRGTAGLAVRDIAREARVSDGALYNYFEDKEDLLAHALLAHVGSVMGSAQPMPRPGTGTVAGNLRQFIDSGLATLVRVTPAFAGLLSQPNVLTRFRAMVGGDEAFGAAGTDPAETAAVGDDAPGHGGVVAPMDSTPGDSPAGEGPAGEGPPENDPAGEGPAGDEDEPRGLPDILTGYLRAEQRLGRIDPGADVDAAATLIVGAMHGQILPRVLFGPPGHPVATPSGLSARLADTVLAGIAPH
jgi:AcrR family transcriptional regulator